jgi:hypothetical protein
MNGYYWRCGLVRWDATRFIAYHCREDRPDLCWFFVALGLN